MIENIWETGFIAVDKTDTEPALLGYAVHILWHDDNMEHKTTLFEGTDVNGVIKDAFKFIVDHYKDAY